MENTTVSQESLPPVPPPSVPVEPTIPPQNLESKPSGKSYWKIVAILLCLLLIAVSGALVYVLATSQMAMQKQETAAITTPTPAPLPDDSTSPNPSVTTAQNNTVYLGKMVTGDLVADVVYFPNTKTAVYKNGTTSQPVEFSKIENPKSIFTSETMTGIQPFATNTDNTKIYLGVSFSKASLPYPSVEQKIYQINLSTNESKEVWTHIVSDEKYKEKGMGEIQNVTEDKFLIISLASCYACDGTDARTTVILNLATGKENYMGAIGNIQINTAANSVSYQKLGESKENCEPGPYCENGKRTVYVPSGATLTAPLP